jgi:hypothetical protein
MVSWCVWAKLSDRAGGRVAFLCDGAFRPIFHGPGFKGGVQGTLGGGGAGGRGAGGSGRPRPCKRAQPCHRAVRPGRARRDVGDTQGRPKVEKLSIVINHHICYGRALRHVHGRPNSCQGGAARFRSPRPQVGSGGLFVRFCPGQAFEPSARDYIGCLHGSVPDAYASIFSS